MQFTAYVSPHGDDQNDGLTPATAKLTPQAALEVLPHGDNGIAYGTLYILGDMSLETP
jgi:hypothetical protein